LKKYYEDLMIKKEKEFREKGKKLGRLYKAKMTEFQQKNDQLSGQISGLNQKVQSENDKNEECLKKSDQSHKS